MRLFGANCPDDLLGKPVLDLFDESSQASVRERIRIVRQEEGGVVPPIELRIRRLDGTAVDVQATASSFLDEASGRSTSC